jgi:hypothetical protein
MTDELVAAVAEVERERRSAARTVVAGPAPVTIPGNPSVVTTYAGEFVGFMCGACGDVVDQVRGGRCAACEEAGAAVRPVSDDHDDEPRSGICGTPGCRTLIDRPRGLCDKHAAVIDALGPLERGRPSRVKSATPPPRDASAPDALGRLPIRVRAERVARAARDAGSLTKAEAAEAAGLESTRGSLPRVLRWAAERDLIVVEQRGPLSRVVPGSAAP